MLALLLSPMRSELTRRLFACRDRSNLRPCGAGAPHRRRRTAATNGVHVDNEGPDTRQWTCSTQSEVDSFPLRSTISTASTACKVEVELLPLVCQTISRPRQTLTTEFNRQWAVYFQNWRENQHYSANHGLRIPNNETL